MQKSSGTEPEVKIEVKVEVKTEVKAETESEVESQEGKQVERQEGERKKKARRGRRSVTAQAIRWEKAVKRVKENALKMKRQSEQNELHSYEIDERLSVSE